MDAQPPNHVPAANTNPLSPATPLSQFVKSTGNTHQKAGSKTRPTPQRKGSRHKLKGGQLNHQSSAYPPVGDPVQHQAFLSAPSKRQARKNRQQDRDAAASFGMPEDLNESGQPADVNPQLGYGVDFNTPDASQSPFGSPYTPTCEFGSPCMPPHPPWQLPHPPQAPDGFAAPYHWNEEESTQPRHEALDGQGLTDQHGPQPRAPHTMIANYGGAANSAPPFCPALPPSFSAHAGLDSQMSHYDRCHASGPSISKSAASAGNRRKSAGLCQNAPRGRYRNSPAPQPAYAPPSSWPDAPCGPRAYAPSSPCTYAPSSPSAGVPSSFSDYSPNTWPADYTKPSGGPSAGNHLQAGPGSQGSPQAAPGNHLNLEQGEPGVSEKRLQWALSRLASLEGRVLRLEASAPSC